MRFATHHVDVTPSKPIHEHSEDELRAHCDRATVALGASKITQAHGGKLIAFVHVQRTEDAHAEHEARVLAFRTGAGSA